MKDVKKQSFIKRMANTGQLNRFLVYLAAFIPATIFVILAFLVELDVIGTLKIGALEISSVDMLLFAAFLATGTFGIYEYLRLKRIRKIDDRFPDFVRDIAESRRAGMTFTKAIMNAAKGNYGFLSVEIEKIAQQISWGSSVENALESFARRINTKLVHRTVSLINEASRSGGNVADVLDAASRDARELKFVESERRASMMSYVAVVYVGMGVFLMIILILCGSLLPTMTGEGAGQLAGTMGGVGDIKMDDVIPVFFYGALFQSAGMGLVAGVFEEGNIVSGVKHTFIMILITWITFKVFVGV